MITSLDKIDPETMTRLHSVQYRDAFRSWLRGDSAAAKDLFAIGDTRQYRALGTENPAQGGFAAPMSLATRMWTKMTQVSAMRRTSTVAQVFGSEYAFVYADDSANRAAILAENTAGVEQDIVISRKNLPTFMFDSGTVRVSLQLLADAGLEAFEEQLADILAARCAGAVNLYASVGAGANQPQGLATAATAGVTGSSPTAVSWNEIEDLIGSVPEAYSYGLDGMTPSATFMMAGSTWKAVRKLADGNSRPLWTPDPSGRSMGVLAGFPCCINTDMPAMAASAKSILFGKLTSYAITDVLLVFVQYREKYGEFLQSAFRVFSRHGAGLVDAEGVRAYQNAAA